ncbi:MAG: DUF1932 domain-containing protein [candidate division Zixibacteria bacterium]|nr:DUF1932 domain-containing protein [candidate division Zixibacteria bacterium]
MQVQRIAILSPGEMGHSVGRCLLAGGFDVATCLTGRSERTRTLTAAAGMRDEPDLDELVRNTDLILAILVPDRARALAGQVAEVMKRTGSSAAYADCNAISPDSAREIDRVITAAGGRFIDAGIIGGPPGADEKTRFYASGPYETILTHLDGHGILVRPLGGEVGRASGIKMCYASVTKGTSALHAAALTAAEVMGLGEELLAEFAESQGQRLKAMSGVNSLSAKAFRWIGEMREIAATYERAGVSPGFHEGAEHIFRLIAESPIGHERPETVDRDRTLEETVAIFAEAARRGTRDTEKG